MKKAISGVYEIRNILNGHKYYGSAVDIKRRFARHKMDLRKGKHHSIYLQRAWDKYGEDSFEFIVLAVCEPNKEELLQMEQALLDTKPEYNISPSARNSQGVIRREETKHKISASLIGHEQFPCTEERKRLLREINTGKHASDEVKQKMSESHLGSTWSAARRAAYKPRLLSEEQKIKIGKSNIGKHNRKKTMEEKQKIGASNTGHVCSDETKEKMRKAHLGKKYKPMTEEGKRNIGEARRRRDKKEIT